MIFRNTETIIGWSLSLLVGYFVLHCVLEIAKRRALLNVNWLPGQDDYRTQIMAMRQHIWASSKFKSPL